MATLVLRADEKLEDIFTYDDCVEDYVVDVRKLDLVLSREGNEHRILKGPFKKSNKIELQ